MRIDLKSGQWVDILPITAIKAKHKDATEAAVKLYVKLDANGNADMSGMPFSMSIIKAQQHVLMAMAILDWSFTASLTDAKGEPVEGTEHPLPVPVWHADGAEGRIDNEESFGEIEIDDWNELEEIIAPYMEKVRRRPDPKGTTTRNSSGSFRERGTLSPRG